MTIEREQAIREGVIHDEDHRRNRVKLDALYGKVAEKQNRMIIEHCVGSRVLDVGAGYGNLTRAAIDAGLDCVGIEIDNEKRRLGREWCNVDLLHRDAHDSGFADGEFDTVIFREVVRHLRLDEVFAEAARITARRVIIFQANSIWPLRLANRLAGHHEYAEHTFGELIAAVETAGFSCRKPQYADPLAFPLSGGYIGPQIVPKWRWMHKIVLGMDRCLERMLGLWPMLGSGLCFRVLIVADKPETPGEPRLGQ